MLAAQTKVEIVTTQGAFTKNEFEKDVLMFSHILRMREITEGDRVILKAENSYWYIVCLFSLCHLDVSIAVVDEQMPDHELSKIYREIGACCLITDAPSEIEGIAVLPIESMIEEKEGYRSGPGKPNPSEITIDRWTRRRDALILFSSGTTGKPKGIMKSGNSFIHNIELSVQAMGYQPDDRLLPLVPFSHFYGISLIFSWWLTQCTLIVCNYKNLWNVISSIMNEKATVVDANPAAYYTFLRMLSRKPHHMDQIRNSTVRMWCVGGSPLTDDLSDRFAKIFNQFLLNGYGLSELGNVTMGTLENPKGCGKPLPGVELRVLDPSGAELAEGETGEIWIRTPGCMEGYLNQEELTQSVIIEGWFKTGDVGLLLEGNLHVLGRAGTLVNRMGYMFSPVYIENQISRVGYRSCVIALDDEKKGTLLIVFVENDTGRSLSMIRKTITQLLPTYMYPDLLLLLAQFPLNRNGKVDRLKLQCLAKEKMHSKNEEEGRGS
ncbi:class I adenylate-forming enzyme family protein [Paenibacillus elgii]